ncbi:hypothetical protein [Corynebacterium tapiri]|uniref:LemA family protein n=1 Tax=Corynebacterium tapiri TaxID=1448266 RepID=A0A5C4U449_9CORY|nr:hypothetical protein [Corynebacterium tapiri]TNL97740.1 hypothetical protein FHE74_05230 [Corynebacterium tapiri]
MNVLIIACLAAVILIAGWAYGTAQRLHTLHIRVDSTLAALEAALDRRAAVIAALEPAAAAAGARAESVPLVHGAMGKRWEAEAELAPWLKGEVCPQIASAQVRVDLARRFYNEAVADARALHLAWPVRVLRLAGTAPLPEFADKEV